MALVQNIANIIFRHQAVDDGFVRVMEGAAAAAGKAAAAGEKVQQTTAKVNAEVTRAVPAWQSVNKSVDENAKLAAATEAANRKLEARLAALRLEASKNAEVAQRAAEFEARFTAQRDASVAKAQQVAAAERARWQAVADGSANASRGVGNFGSVAASAGQQMQDVVIQAQMGTNAFTILAQQGSQFLGIFGPAGAMAGAALALGAVGLQMAGLAGNVKDLDDVLKDNAANFDRVKAAAEERAKGVKAEAEAVDALAVAYKAMGETAARAEGIALARQNRALNERAGDLVEGLGGRLAADLRQRENAGLPNIANFEDLTGLGNQAARLAPDLNAAVAAFSALRDQTGPTVDGLRSYIAALDDAAKAGGGNRAAILALRDAAIDALPKATELEKAMQANAVQAAAMRLAAGESAEALLAAGRAAGTSAGGFNQLSPAIVNAAAALARLRRDFINDPLREVNAEASRIADLAAALRGGGTDTFKRVKAEQDAAAESLARLNRITKEYIATRMGEGAGQDVAEAEAQARRAGWAQDIERVRQANADLAAEADRVAEAERKAEAAAKRAATAHETAARKAAEAQAEFDRNHYSEPRLTGGGNLLSLGTSDDKVMAFLRTRSGEINREQKTLADTARRTQREIERDREAAAKSTTDSIVRYSADAFADLFKDTGKSWGDMWKGFLGTARATLARIAAEAVIRVAIEPLVRDFYGSTGGASGSSGSTSAGGMLSSVLGLGGSSGTGSSGPGWVSRNLSAAQTSMDSWGQSSGWFGNGIAPNAQGPMPDGSTVGTLSQSGTFGTQTTTQFLGSAGRAAGGVVAGYGVGSQVGGMVAGNSKYRQQNAQIGAGVGAVVGAIWGPVGSMVGGAIGGAIGGMFGAGEKGLRERSGGDVAYGNVNGQLQIIGGGGKRQDMAAAFAEVQQQLDAINNAIAARGLILTGGTGMVGFGQASRNPTAVNREALAGTLISGNANVQTAINNRGSRSLEQLLGEIDFVQQVYEPATKAAQGAGVLQQQLDALWNQFAPVIERANALGLSTEKLSAAWDKANAAAVAGFYAMVRASDDAMSARMMRATGNAAGAASIDFETAARGEVVAYRAQLEAWGLAAADVAERMVTLERVQGAERVAAAREAARAAAAQDLGRWTSGVSLQARLFRAQGDELNAAVWDFEASAANDRVNLRTALEDTFTDAGEIARQMNLLEQALGLERVQIVKDANEQIKAAEESRAGQAAGIVRSLADYATSLRTRQDSPLSATQQYWGASQDFQSVLASAQSGSADAMGRLSGVSDTFLAASRTLYGSGSGFAQDWTRVLDALSVMATKTPDELTASILQTEIRSQTEVLADELTRLRTEVTALRKEVQLQGAAPRAA